MHVLHLQKCRSNNPLMDNRACKGQISRIFASLFPNYGRKSHDSWRDIHPFMGRAAGKYLMEMPENHRRIAIQWADTQ